MSFLNYNLCGDCGGNLTRDVDMYVHISMRTVDAILKLSASALSSGNSSSYDGLMSGKRNVSKPIRNGCVFAVLRLVTSAHVSHPST